MFILKRRDGYFAHELSQGEHDGMVTPDVTQAAAFDTRVEAYDFRQNFGNDWRIVEL